MATFLGIYSKDKTSEHPLIKEIIEDFTLQNTRSVVHFHFPGMHFIVADKFSNYYCPNESGFSFVSGHIAFTGDKNPASADNMARNFHEQYLLLNEKCAVNAEGAFAAIEYNEKRHCLFLVNDKFGTFPLFISENEEFIAFSNEYQPLIAFQEKNKRKINKEAVAEFFSLGICLGDKTFFKHINNLNPASFLKSENGKTHAATYFTIQQKTQDNKTDAEVAGEFYELFKNINREYAQAGHFDLCLLSAGADSRLIVSTLTDEQRNNLTFYTSNLSFLEPDEDMDAVGASMITKKFNLKHRLEKISFFENQFSTDFFENERKLRASHVYGGWHGGELLGGFCFNAAPINKILTAEEINKKYKSIFSWWYRLKTKNSPAKNYADELKRYETQGGLLHFMIHQLTRGFFTNIYGGTRGHWVQPYQLANHGFSPFWDSRFLQKLLEVPVEKLKNYSLYNQIFRYCDKEFTQIPSNSPLTRRTDSVIPPMITGIEPKGKIPNTHKSAYQDKLRAFNQDKKGIFNKIHLKKIITEEQHPLTKQWLDFEVWFEKYGLEK